MQTSGNEALPKKLFRVLLSVFVLLFSASLAQSPATSPANASPTEPGYLDPLPQDTGAAGLKQQLRKLQNTGRLMMVVAHPDDEDGGLLTLEARGKGVQTLLLTLTRGEGGQNKMGSSLFDVLGVLRTLELLASDRYYGVEQRFTRVADFGYSKTADETFQKWRGHDVPLQDVVRVIRQFRPDVLVARFSGTENDGHGHHQASAILTKEAFRAAADPNRFPEQIKEGLQPWQAKKVYIGNVCGFGASSCPDENYTVKLNTGEDDPVLGMSYVQFAIEGLHHQQSQGLADLRIPSGPRYAFYKLADSVLPSTKDANGHEKDMFDGINTTLPGLVTNLGEEEKKVPWLRGELENISSNLHRAEQNGQKESIAVVVPLLAVAQGLKETSKHLERSSVDDTVKQRLIQYLKKENDVVQSSLAQALNVSVSAFVVNPEGEQEGPPNEKHAFTVVSPGQRLTVVVKFHNGFKHALTMDNVSFEPSTWVKKTQQKSQMLEPGADARASFDLQVPADAESTRPYWHRNDPERDSRNDIDDERFVTLPFPPYRFGVHVTYHLHRDTELNILGWNARGAAGPSGQFSVPVVVPVLDAHQIVRKRELAVGPSFSVVLETGERVVAADDDRATPIATRIRTNLDGAPNGTLRVRTPGDWHSDPVEQVVTPKGRGAEQEYVFKASRSSVKEGTASLMVSLDSSGRQYTEGYTLVTREDLGSFYYFQPAVQHVSIVDLRLPKDLKVGYIMGAGDDIPTVLQQIGMNVTLIPAEKLATENLSQYGTIVLGVRAYDTQKELVANNKKLLDFVSSGGTLIVQNNNSVGDFNSGHFMPYPADLSRARVSVEEAPVRILAPDDPIFHFPNEISQKDFDGWVQERGLYFMGTWDEHFKPLLACHDPNEPDQKGGLLVAKYGKGTYIYTGYAFFRQLPAGVPGAIRLFVNLVSANANH